MTRSLSWSTHSNAPHHRVTHAVFMDVFRAIHDTLDDEPDARLEDAKERILRALEGV